MPEEEEDRPDYEEEKRTNRRVFKRISEIRCRNSCQVAALRSLSGRGGGVHEAEMQRCHKRFERIIICVYIHM